MVCFHVLELTQVFRRFLILRLTNCIYIAFQLGWSLSKIKTNEIWHFMMSQFLSLYTHFLFWPRDFLETETQLLQTAEDTMPLLPHGISREMIEAGRVWESPVIVTARDHGFLRKASEKNKIHQSISAIKPLSCTINTLQ